MSEYQYYEFLAIDRPLGPDEIASIRQLSSRVQPTPTHAVFTYSFGDFRGNPLNVLAKYYDVMLYIANWGTKQLAFRFPKAAIDIEALQPYYYGVEEIELTMAGDYVILNITFQEEEGFDWIEGEGELAGLAPLRDDILRGDLRALYLIWLAAAGRGGGEADEWGDVDDGGDTDGDDPIEPPVPPGLGQLTAPLRALMEFFDIDQDLVGAAALASPSLKATADPIEDWIALLPEAERNALLVRAARGEAVGPELLRRLRELGGQARPSARNTPRRTFSEIEQAAEGVRQQRQKREQQAAERARLARLEALAKREEQVWAEIPGLLALRTARGYDDAVTHMTELRALAIHQKQRAAFDARLRDMLVPFAGSAALMRRLREKKLVE